MDCKILCSRKLKEPSENTSDLRGGGIMLDRYGLGNVLGTKGCLIV